MNVMLVPRVDKVTVHIGTGESGQRLVNAETILGEITNRSPVRSVAKKTLPGFGIKKKEPIGCRVTLRGKDAEEFLRVALEVAGGVLRKGSFDETGNFSFGVEEHTDFPGMKYEPEIGIFGMDVSVVLERPGVRIARRREQQKKLPNHQRVTKDDAIAFMTEAFGVEVR